MPSLLSAPPSREIQAENSKNDPVWRPQITTHAAFIAPFFQHAIIPGMTKD
jgi:hypothetical protein